MLRHDVIHRIVERELSHHNLTEEQVLQEAPELHQAACEYFGSWYAALHYAGVDFRHLHGQPPDSREWVLERIRRLCRDGYSLASTHVRRRDFRLYRLARQHFGDWRQALLAAGFDLQRARRRSSKFRRYDKQEVIASLCEWQKAGHSLRWMDVCLQNRILATAAKCAFTSWRKALLAAGIDPQGPQVNQKSPRAIKSPSGGAGT